MVNLRWFAVWQRNFNVWRYFMVASLLGSLGEPLIFLVAFGYGLGGLIGTINGVPYFLFLAAGIMCSSSINTASFEAMYSAYTRMAVQHVWQAILATPIEIKDIVLGEIVWAGTKSIVAGIMILIVLAGVGQLTHWHVLLIVPLAFLLGCCFAGIALTVTAFSYSYEFFMYYFTLFLIPLVMLSGVFFPLEQLPTGLQILAYGLPLSHGVSISRSLILAQPMATHWVIHIGVILVYTVAAYGFAVLAIKRRLLK